jgi:hypothetical protein
VESAVQIRDQSRDISTAETSGVDGRARPVGRV